MRSLPAWLALGALTLSAPAAVAGPFGGGGRPPQADRRDDKRDEKRDDKNPEKAREQRLKMLRRVHTQFVLELGELLDLDTAGMLKLSERLQKYDDQRIQLRLDTWDAVQQLKGIARGEGTGDAPGLARRAAQNRVKLAELDQKELDEVLQGLAPDKAAKVALFTAEFGKRIERMAQMMREHRGGPGGPGFGPPPGGPGEDD